MQNLRCVVDVLTTAFSEQKVNEKLIEVPSGKLIDRLIDGKSVVMCEKTLSANFC